MRIEKILLSFCVFFILIFINLYYVSFDKNFYFSEFDKYNTYSSFKDKSIVNDEFGKVIDYIKNGKEINGDFFNLKEKKHLKDVRNIFNILKILFALSLVILIFYLIKNKKIFLKSILTGSLAAIIFIFILIIISLLSFEILFFNFHKIIFTNNLWLLNPDEDHLIRLLPLEIFYDIFKRLCISIILSSFVVLSVAFFNKYYVNDRRLT